ncbi:MAG TPA: PKD domain-containing protein [Thermoplasmata archaeon]|nr:PKD domain-containing protein [Thermoplasmata archaeon]
MNLSQFGNWSKVVSASSSTNLPKARAGSQLVYDPVIRGDVLFGGYDASYIVLNDTWIWRNDNWTQLRTPVAPAPRVGYGMTYDPADGFLVLFAGYNGTLYNDTWKFNGTNWTQLTEAVAPPPMEAPVMTYDALDGYVLLAGGTTSRVSSTGGAYSASWKFSGGVWTNITSNTTGALTKSPGRYRSAAYDARDQYVVVYGGERSAGSCAGRGETWTYARGVWTNITRNQSASPPGAQGSGGAMAYDPDETGVMIEGSYDSSCNINNGTWIFSHGQWRNVSAYVGKGPSGRVLGGLAWDASVQALILFGGNGQSSWGALTFPRDTWSYGISFHNDATQSTIGGPVPITINFSAIPSGGAAPYNYSWSYGDESPPGTTQNVSHQYTIAGGHMVTLTVIDSKGNRSISIGYVTAFGLPTVDPTTGDAPLRVAFTRAAFAGNAPVSINWTFGDGNRSTAQNTTYRYANGGTFHWTYTMVDGQGNRVLANGTIVVTPPLKIPSITASPARHSIPVTVAFSVKTTGGTPPFVTNWTFGDGTYGSGYSTSHMYTTVGTYAARFTIRDATNISVNNSVQVHAGTLVNALIQATPTIGFAPLDVRFTEGQYGGFGPYQSNWSFGPAGAVAVGNSAEYNYTIPGIYHVELTVVDSVGDNASNTTTITVFAPLITTLSANRSEGVYPMSVGFRAVAAGGIGSWTYNWSFGDGSVVPYGSAAETHTFVRGGEFTATVDVSDTAGNRVLGALVIRTAPPLSLFVAANLSIIGEGGSVLLRATPLGGFIPLTFVWSGLPAPCLSANSSWLTCTPSTAGTFTINVSATDPVGDNTSASLTLKVTKLGPVCCLPSPYSSNGGNSQLQWTWILIAIVSIAAASVGVAAAVRRRRRGAAEGDDSGGAPSEGELGEPADGDTAPSDSDSSADPGGYRAAYDIGGETPEDAQ